MNRFLILLSIIMIVFSSCTDDEPQLFEETGTVVDYAGAGKCSVIIELDNSKRVQPLYFPEEFVFTHNQRVLVKYTELRNIINSCDRGVPCEISYAEELSCAPFVVLDDDNYHSLQKDPVEINQAYIDGECLLVKLSFGGGCGEHQIDLARIVTTEASKNELPVFEIRHNANNDLCEAWLTREYRFNIQTLIDEGITAFVLNARGPNNTTFSKKIHL